MGWRRSPVCPPPCWLGFLLGSHADSSSQGQVKHICFHSTSQTRSSRSQSSMARYARFYSGSQSKNWFLSHLTQSAEKKKGDVRERRTRRRWRLLGGRQRPASA